MTFTYDSTIRRYSTNAPAHMRPRSHVYNNTPARVGLVGRASKAIASILITRLLPSRLSIISKTLLGSCVGRLVNQLAKKIRLLLPLEYIIA